MHDKNTGNDEGDWGSLKVWPDQGLTQLKQTSLSCWRLYLTCCCFISKLIISQTHHRPALLWCHGGRSVWTAVQINTTHVQRELYVNVFEIWPDWCLCAHLPFLSQIWDDWRRQKQNQSESLLSDDGGHNRRLSDYGYSWQTGEYVPLSGRHSPAHVCTVILIIQKTSLVIRKEVPHALHHQQEFGGWHQRCWSLLFLKVLYANCVKLMWVVTHWCACLFRFPPCRHVCIELYELQGWCQRPPPFSALWTYSMCVWVLKVVSFLLQSAMRCRPFDWSCVHEAVV